MSARGRICCAKSWIGAKSGATLAKTTPRALAQARPPPHPRRSFGTRTHGHARLTSHLYGREIETAPGAGPRSAFLGVEGGHAQPLPLSGCVRVWSFGHDARRVFFGTRRRSSRPLNPSPPREILRSLGAIGLALGGPHSRPGAPHTPSGAPHSVPDAPRSSNNTGRSLTSTEVF